MKIQSISGPKNNSKKLLTTFAERAYNPAVAKKTVKTLTVDEVIAMMRDEQAEAELSLRQYAAKLGITPGYLVDLYKGNRTPGPTILSRFGLAKKTVTLYEKVA